jgi:UTP--glucose-1-phosphate uridylyltransferase
MGLERAKSLLELKDGLTFLDIIALQSLKGQFQLVLMNSFATRQDSLRALGKYEHLGGDLPLDFLQHKVPKVRQSDLMPAAWPANPSLEWCPPGHGDVYAALVTSGMLQTLQQKGYRYAFISNSDNLGGVLDEGILGYFVSKQIPFLMEVADRTEADRKGGHLARLADGSGRLILRESAQCSERDWDEFQNVQKHKYFNTNNLWLDLASLRKLMLEQNNILKLPMIRNPKTVDPRDPASTPVFQLESAMGSVIQILEGSEALRVPRTRLTPVKTCPDLLATRSDLTVLAGNYQLHLDPSRALGPPRITLDPQFYGRLAQMEERFPDGPPSLLRCERLSIKGDFRFGKGVTLRGKVELVNESGQQKWIPDGSEIEGEWKA